MNRLERTKGRQDICLTSPGINENTKTGEIYSNCIYRCKVNHGGGSSRRAKISILFVLSFVFLLSSIPVLCAHTFYEL